MTGHMEQPAGAFPMGTLTLLFADIEGSTQLLHQLGERYTLLQTEYLHLLRTSFLQWNGYEVDTQGDAFFVVFARATDAISAAIGSQRSLATHLWPGEVTVRVRMGLHTGTPERTALGYIGLDVNYAARLMHTAYGGQVLLSQTTRELIKHTLPIDVSLLDLGEHRLRDFPNPRRIFQLAISDVSADFPPLCTTEYRLQNLPVQLTTLIGREQESAAVYTLLQREEVRLVTLTGTGGIGKTRLGIEVAARLLETYADGIVFVPLAPIVHPVLVLPAIKQALGLAQQQRGQNTDHLDDLKAFLRDRHVLLVLDNFEQVLTAAPNLTALLLACPNLKLLVTSRAVLRVQGEYEFVVPPLALPKRTHLPAIEVLTQYASVALFVERALAIKPDLALTKANIQAIATICVHLDGLPLAIELAAARVKLLPPLALLRQLTLTHRIEVLTGGTRDVPERQQTLRNTLAWSYNLLNEKEQQLFRLLSVFVGGCSLEAIAAVSEAIAGETGSLLDTIASLIDKSLLHQVEQEGTDAHFVMLETIREYGLDCLHARGEKEVAWQAIAGYYVALAEQAEPQYAGPEQAAWLQRLEREHENIRAVLQWQLAQGEAGHDMTMALRLGAALRSFWVIHGPFREGRFFLERALATREGVAIPVQAKALFAAANMAGLQGDFAAAEAFCQECLRMFRQLGDRPGIAYALYILAWVAKGDITYDVALTKEALALFKEIGNREFVAWSIYTLAYLDYLRGEYETAFRLFKESLVLHKELGNTWGIANALLAMTQLHIVSQRNLAIAEVWLDESLPLLKELNDQNGLAYAGALRGLLAFHRGDIAQARVLIEESLLEYKKMGSLQGIAERLCQLAQVVIAQGDPMTTASLYMEGLVIARELSLNELIATCLEGLAGVATIQETYDWAACLWGTAEALREAVHVPIPLSDRASYERTVTRTRVRLGENAFAALWAQGRTMTPEEVLALQGRAIVLPSSQSTAPPPAIYPAGLTAREVQILRLVAQGLTNVEIAEELRLSKKTIAHHMTHIFNKTTSDNRASAVAFAFRHGLA